MRRFLCLYLPRWPLQRLLNERPEIAAERAVALYERSAHGPRLAVCSVQANKLGVKRGMLMADATSLAPGLELYEINREADREGLDKLTLWAGRFSPMVGVENVSAGHPQSLLLDISGCAQVFHGEKNLLKLALQSLARKNIKARAAIAPTIGAAWALAHFEANGTIVEQLSSQTGSQQSVLSPLPLAALRIDPEAISWMHKLGIYKVGDLLKQPRSTLPSRFGTQLIERIDQALGTISENMPLIRPAPEFHAARAFEYPVRNLELLYNVIEKLVEKICAELQERCRGAREVECWLYHEVSDPIFAGVTFFKPSALPAHLMQLLKTRLEDLQLKLQNPSRKSNRTPASKQPHSSFSLSEGGRSVKLEADDGICAVALRVLSSETLDAEQLALFAQALRAPENLSLTLDRLRTRLGSHAVLRAKLVDDAQPEDAVALTPLHEAAPSASPPPDSPRPLQLFTKPIPIEIEWPDQMEWPRSFEFQSRHIQIQHAHGPERIETGWWKESSAHRDYYIVDSVEGNRYWIFRELIEDRWFVHGVFN